MFDLGNGSGSSHSSRLRAEVITLFIKFPNQTDLRWGSRLLATYLRGFHQLLAELLFRLLQPAVCLKRTQKATRLAQPRDVSRHFATDPSAWHLVHMPIAERPGPAPAPTPFCGSQKTARAWLWSRANYSSLKRGEKLYLCCQLLEKHKDFCGFKKTSVCVCVWQGGRQHTHGFIWWFGFWTKGKGQSRRQGLHGYNTTWRTWLRVCNCLLSRCVSFPI